MDDAIALFMSAQEKGAPSGLIEYHTAKCEMLKTRLESGTLDLDAVEDALQLWSNLLGEEWCDDQFYLDLISYGMLIVERRALGVDPYPKDRDEMYETIERVGLAFEWLHKSGSSPYVVTGSYVKHLNTTVYYALPRRKTELLKQVWTLSRSLSNSNYGTALNLDTALSQDQGNAPNAGARRDIISQRRQLLTLVCQESAERTDAGLRLLLLSPDDDAVRTIVRDQRDRSSEIQDQLSPSRQAFGAHVDGLLMLPVDRSQASSEFERSIALYEGSVGDLDTWNSLSNLWQLAYRSLVSLDHIAGGKARDRWLSARRRFGRRQ
jgi:hypothetical protein